MGVSRVSVRSLSSLVYFHGSRAAEDEARESDGGMSLIAKSCGLHFVLVGKKVSTYIRELETAVSCVCERAGDMKRESITGSSALQCR